MANQHTIRHHVGGAHIHSREDAMADFYATHRKYNGGRRRDPEEYITIVQVREWIPPKGCHGRGRAFDIWYTVPADVRRHMHAPKVPEVQA